VGTGVGSGVGTDVGSWDGTGLGSGVGAGEGIGEGFRDGVGDGRPVGIGVGSGVGTGDGLGMGSDDPPPPPPLAPRALGGLERRALAFLSPSARGAVLGRQRAGRALCLLPHVASMGYFWMMTIEVRLKIPWSMHSQVNGHSASRN
jgi:hypothetical protein